MAHLRTMSAVAWNRVCSSATLNTTFASNSRVRLFRFMSSVVTLGDEMTVEKFLTVNHKAVLYFTASWCPPCKAIKPVYEELAKKYPDVAFGKVDVDDNADAASEFEISAVPTFVFFDSEDPVERFSGADQTRLEKQIQELQKR